MESEIDQHHIDSTSPISETAVGILLQGACFDPTALSALQSPGMSPPSSFSFSRDDLDCLTPDSSALMTSTSTPIPPRPKNLPSRLLATPKARNSPRGSGCSSDSLGVGACVSVAIEGSMEEEHLRAPIIGYEIMEQRAKFTVFKIHVRKSDQENWLIFRRYTDFKRVNDKLKEIFPMFRLALPPKRWFGSNFDPTFLEDRQLGLQAFIDNIIGHKDVVLSGPVREFLCLDDPPGPYDNLEESRALCESLDETVYSLRIELAERDRRIASLNMELEAAQERISQLLHGQLQSRDVVSKAGNTHNSTPVSGENSTIEGDLHSQAEADQLSFAETEVHYSSPKSPEKEVSPQTDKSQPKPTPSKASSLKQGLEKQKDEQEHNSEPNVITVT